MTTSSKENKVDFVASAAIVAHTITRMCEQIQKANK